MAFVEKGTFNMGVKSEFSHTEPVHEVEVESFYIRKILVSHQEYKDIVGKQGFRNIHESSPEIFISWYEALRFCNLLSN